MVLARPSRTKAAARGAARGTRFGSTSTATARRCVATTSIVSEGSSLGRAVQRGPSYGHAYDASELTGRPPRLLLRDRIAASSPGDAIGARYYSSRRSL